MSSPGVVKDSHPLNTWSSNHFYKWLLPLHQIFNLLGLSSPLHNLSGKTRVTDFILFKHDFQLRQIVKFPTRGDRTLDVIFTNMKEYYETPVKRPAFGLSDHATIEIQPLLRSHQPTAKRTVLSRDLRRTKKNALSSCLVSVVVDVMVKSKESCEEKLEARYFFC